jgi:hypothetical protein
MPGPVPDGPDWSAIAALAESGVTLVIYMGVSHIDRIVGQLLRTLPASLPAAVVQHASSGGERTIAFTAQLSSVNFTETPSMVTRYTVCSEPSSGSGAVSSIERRPLAGHAGVASAVDETRDDRFGFTKPGSWPRELFRNGAPPIESHRTADLPGTQLKRSA